MTVSDFLNYELVDYASYSTMRQIASLVDGLKNSSRKVIYTMQTKIKDDTKVEILAGITSVNTEYLHGPQSLNSVIVGLAQDFAGSNNIPLLIREGIFGTRFEHNASAPRYIFTNKEPYFDKIFRPEMNPILIGQIFEGSKIEPRYYVPSIPLLLVNGSEGVATGFAQKILPRNPTDIIKAIKCRLEDPKYIYEDICPYFNGFSGTIEKGDNENQWLINGKFEKISSTKLRITEIPVMYDLTSYIKILDALVDSKYIRSYVDSSEDDKFLFEVDIDSKVLKETNYQKMLENLGLSKKVTENFTCLNEFNRIEEYKSYVEILDHYLRVKLEYTEKLKNYMVITMQSELNLLKSKYFFIKGIIDGNIVVHNKKKNEIVDQLKETMYIIDYNGSYDYLVNMPIHSLSEETFKSLTKTIKEKKKIYDEYKLKSINDLYLEELKELIENLNKQLKDK